MKISLQTGNVLDRFGIEEGFRLIKEAGFEAVDLNMDHCLWPAQISQGDCSGFYDQTDEEILEACRPYKEAAAKYGLTITQAHAPFPTRVHNEEMNAYVEKAVQKTIMMCGYLECPRLVVHEGFLPYADRTEDEFDYNIKMYTTFIPYLKKYNVICCLENLFTGNRGHVMAAACAAPDEAIRYLDTLNEIAGERLFGFCLDIGHALLCARDVQEFIIRLDHRLECLHIHDNNGIKDDHVLPYWGLTDWNRFCNGLRAIGYEKDLSFETFHATDLYPAELVPHVLKLSAATAGYFRTQILGDAL